jgi:hypothetical protein
VVLGLLAGLPDLRARLAAEAGDHRVELVADQATFTELADALGVPPAAFLRQMKAVGVQALGVPEDTLASLDFEGRITVVSGASWLDARRAAGLPAPTFPVDPYGTYVFTEDGRLAAWLVPALRAALGPGVAVAGYRLGATDVVAVRMLPDQIEGIPLGFAPGAFQLARSAGLHVVPRPEDTPAGLSPAAVQALYARIASSGVPVDAVLFAGVSTQPIPGYPQAFAATVQAFRTHGWLLGLLETPQQLSNVDQPGTFALAQALGERAVRVYSVPPWLLAAYSEPQAVTALLDSVIERNLRLVYLHPVVTGPDPVAATVTLYRDLAEQLRAHGFTLATPRPFPTVVVPRWQRVLQGLAVVAAGLLLLELLFPALGRWGYQPLVVLGGLVGLLCLASSKLSVELVGMAAASVFGGLSVYYAAWSWNRARWPRYAGFGAVWRQAVGLSVTMAGISFAGALLIGTLMGDTMHFLEWEYFRGVKLTYLGIPFLAALAFLASVGIGVDAEGRQRPSGLRDVWGELRALGELSVKFKYAGAFLVVAAIGWYYLHRSGNVSSIPAIEAAMRQALARLLTYRPREKDFLVGYPSVFLAAFFAARRQRWPFFVFLLGASVGQVSLIDAFDHIRTPFLNSVQRESFGLVLGMLVGTVALAVFHGVWRLAVAHRSARVGAGADPRAARAAAPVREDEGADDHALVPAAAGPDRAGRAGTA